jgi:hypothetical protein
MIVFKHELATDRKTPRHVPCQAMPKMIVKLESKTIPLGKGPSHKINKVHK